MPGKTNDGSAPRPPIPLHTPEPSPAARAVKPPTPPRGLGKRGREFWRSVQADFTFEAHETRLLHEACRMLDAIDDLDARVSTDGVMIEGSQGQRVLHPAVAERRQQQLAFSQLVGKLHLEGEEELAEQARDRSAKMKRAAETRWAKARRG